MKLTVLRLGHRHFRDQRLTTHIFLTARALGANEVIYSGLKDKKLEESINDIVERWGGPFLVSYEKNFRKIIKNFKGVKVHLTVYGLPIMKNIGKIRKTKKNLLIIVGGEKVPGKVYSLVDYNIAVGNQPHSEVAALSVFLHEFFQRKELDKKFKKAKIKVIPQKRGKLTIN